MVSLATVTTNYRKSAAVIVAEKVRKLTGAKDQTVNQLEQIPIESPDNTLAERGT